MMSEPSSHDGSTRWGRAVVDGALRESGVAGDVCDPDRLPPFSQDALDSYQRVSQFFALLSRSDKSDASSEGQATPLR
jgi:hypothetical protein